MNNLEKFKKTLSLLLKFNFDDTFDYISTLKTVFSLPMGLANYIKGIRH
jgi:hypothetical protein